MELKEKRKMEKNNSNEKLRYWLLISGILNVVFYLLHDCIGAMNYPGYNWMAQAVSDLTAVDAPSRIIAGALSNIGGSFTLIVCTLICIHLKDLWPKAEEKILRLGVYLFIIMHWVSAIGYGLFPLTGSGYDGSVQSFIHVFVITAIVVLLSIVYSILIAIGGFKSGDKVLAWCAVVSLILMFAGAVGSGIVPREYFGIPERFSTYSAGCFTSAIAIIALVKLGKKEE